MSTKSIVPLSGVEAHVFIMRGRSTANRARDAGARSVEARIVFYAKSSEIQLDPEQESRRNTPYFIPEALWFIRPGPVLLEDRSPSLEIPSIFDRF